MENGQKLDNIQDTMTELRVSMAQLSGDVRASLARHDRQDVVTADVERRLRSLETGRDQVPEVESLRRADVEGRVRSLERRSYSIPSLAALLGLAGFALALWLALHR